jgi:VWFA-related protein
MRELLRRSAILAAGFATLAGSAPPFAAAPARPASRADHFEERVDVIEVEIPVEVRDRDGKPVRGLESKDFRILDEGKKREITRFEAIDLSVTAGEAAPAAPPPRVAMPRHVLLLFDLSFSSPIAVGKARIAARRVVLEALHPSDLVAVATFSLETGPRLLVTFTPDRAQVARAIDGLSFDRSNEQRALDPLRFLLPFAGAGTGEVATSQGGVASEARREIENIGGETASIQAEMAAREGRRYEASRVANWMQDLGDIGRYLAAVEGRKQILLFSEGFDSRLLLGRSDLTDPDVETENLNLNQGEHWRVDNDLRYGNTTLLNESQRMIEQLKRADCVVHSVDIGGLRAAGEGQRIGRSLGEDGLFFLANESGGQFFSDANDLAGQMRDVLKRTEVSYLLAFSASDVPMNGAWRRIAVDLVGNKGYKVYSRDGWYAPRPYQEMHPLERDLLTADAIAIAAPRHEIGLSAIAAPFRAGAGPAYVPVILEIDGKSLLATKAQRYRLDLYAYATTVDGEFRAFFHRELGIDTRAGGESLARGGVKYYGHVELPTGSYQLRVLVRDGDNGRLGAVVLPLRVPDYASARPELLPPFFFDAPGRWNLVRERESSPDGSVVYPFVVGGEPFVPRAAARFRAGERPQVFLAGYDLSAGDLEIVASWLGPEGEQPAVLAVERRETGSPGYRQWLAELDLSGRPAGESRLRLQIVDRKSGQMVATTETTVQIDI